jgi:hypothetical protein
VKIILLLLSLLATGCASRGTANGTRHIVERKQTAVVIPATVEAPAQIVPLIETTETWEDTESRYEEIAGPDLKQIAPAVAALSSAAATGVTGGTGLLAVFTTVATGLLAYGAREVLARKDQNKQAADAQQRIDYLKQQRDEAAARAEAYALKLPPS